MAGTLVIDTLKSSTANPPVFQNTSSVEIGTLCRAWASFTGTTGAIRGSFNVSSVTRNTTGDYTLNFTSALADANYALVASAMRDLTGSEGMITGPAYAANYTTTTCRFRTTTDSGAAGDGNIVGAAIFR